MVFPEKGRSFSLREAEKSEGDSLTAAAGSPSTLLQNREGSMVFDLSRRGMIAGAAALMPATALAQNAPSPNAQLGKPRTG